MNRSPPPDRPGPPDDRAQASALAEGRISLAAALGGLARELDVQQPPPLPERVLALLPPARPAPPLGVADPAAWRWPAALRWLHWLRWLGSGHKPLSSGAARCALALIGSVVLLVLTTDPPGGGQARGAGSPHLGGAANQVAAGAIDDGEFVPVATAERWQRLGATAAPMAAWLVPSDLPRERLAALGLPFDPARAGESVRAELLLHASGEVLALRVVQR